MGLLEAGFLVGLGLTITFLKLSWRARLRMLSHPVAMDIAVFTLLVLLHWGTFSGVMAATVGALMCSLLLSLGRVMFGYFNKGRYVPGRIVVKELT